METDWLKGFKAMYQTLNADNLELLANWYHADVCFTDPLHQVKGLSALERYFAGMYANVTAIEFHYQWQIEQGEEVVLGWTMCFSHPKLNGGKSVEVEGVSRLQICDGKVLSHRDYFDAGAMLYEQIPLFGTLVKAVKKRAASE